MGGLGGPAVTNECEESCESSKSAASTSDSTAHGPGAAGLIVGVLGLAAAAFAVVRSRSNGSRSE